MKKRINKIVIISLIVIILAAFAVLAAFVVMPVINGPDGASGGECTLSVNTEGLELDIESGSYLVREKLTCLSGTLEDGEAADTIECTVLRIDGIPVMNESLTAAESWSTDSLSLAYGVNLITVRALSNGNPIAASELKVVNICSEAYTGADTDTDTDGDGLFDLFELEYTFTSPAEADSDGNGSADGDEDPDSDGVSNGTEMLIGTLPLIFDTDSDGISDGDEYAEGLDPLSEDTDADGITDGDEKGLGHDPKTADDAERIGTYIINDIRVGDAFTLSAELQVPPTLIGRFKVSDMPCSAVISPERVEGMVGCAMVFSVDGEVKKGKITVTVNDGYYDEDEDYAIYYVNEETLMFERVSSQKNTDNVITADLPHFSSYVVLREPQDDYRSFAQYFEDPFADPEETDSDYDGFSDSEDTTPYFAKMFKSYSDYLKYVYPEKDVLTVLVELPGGASYPDRIADVIAGEDGSVKYDTGHTWISYTDENGTETFGFTPDDTSSALFGENVAGSISRDESETAAIMLPIEVDPSAKGKLDSFIENFSKEYGLYGYNDATFVLDVCRELGVELNVPSYIKGLESSGSMQALFKDAKSPAHIADYILNDRKDEYVICGEDGCTSQYAEDRAMFEQSETVSDVLKYTSSDKIEWEGHTYQLFNTSMTWNDAKAYCESLGGHLVTIASAEEQAIIEKLMENGTKKQYWLGLDTETGWVTGEDIDYSNWDRGEPNSCRRRGMNERYAHILNVPNPVRGGSSRFKWNDMFNDNTFPGEEDNFSLNTVGVICEWDTAEK